MALLDQILGPLEIALNRALGSSPQALEQLGASQEPIALYFRDLAWGFRLQPCAHGLQLLPGMGESRSAVSTSLVGLARLMAGEDPREMGQALVLEGDAEYLEAFLGNLRQARIDLEAEITALLGPVLGSRLGQGIRDLLNIGQQSLKTLLQGEVQKAQGAGDAGLADIQEAGEWMDAVDDAATALDRLQARIERLEQGDA